METEKVVEAVQKVVECPICMDSVQRPVLLDCLHVFCTECLKQQNKGCRKSHLKEDQLECSLCKTISDIPKGGIDNFKVAFWYNEVRGLVESLEKSKGNRRTCSEHKDQQLGLYCETCKELICISCTVRKNKHHNHEYLELEKAFKHFKVEIGLSQKKLAKQIALTEQTLSNLQSYRQNIDKQKSTISNNLKKDVRKTHVMSQISRIICVLFSSFLKEEERLKNAHSMLKACSDFLFRCLETTCHYEVMEMKVEVRQRVESLKAPIQSDLFFAVLNDTQATGYSMNVMLYNGK